MSDYKAIHLVSHTHWDREWYMPFEAFRYRLVGLIDRLLGIMAEDESYRYHLDGQTIVLDDYLELRPERREELQRLISSGRLSIGPWYVLIDEFLVSGESIIRNLEEGRRSGAAFGPMLEAGYLPDTFGHISQMPQLLKKFGIGQAVVWRGLNGSPEEMPTEFDWEAPSGDRVAAIHLPYRYGYTSAMELPEEPELAAERLRELIAHIGPHARSGHVLLMNGFDHMEPQRHIPELVAYWNGKEATPLIHSGIADYMEAALGAASERPVLAGAFRRTNHAPGGEINTILPNVLSARVYLKQQNAAAQTLMEKAVEPLEALTSALGGTPQPAFVRQAWRYILQNHPHDSICGCSIDAVHDEMELRFAKAAQIGNQLVVDALSRLAEAADRSWIAEGSVPVLLFNTLPWSRSASVEIELDADDDTVYRSVEVVDERGVRYEAEIAGIERLCPIEPDSARYPLGKREVVRHTVRVFATSLPPFGYRLVGARLKKQPVLNGLPLQPSGAAIGNEFIRVTAEPDGTLTWLDLETGERRTGLHRFEDSGDVGDEYSYSPPVLNESWTAPVVRSISVKGDGRSCRTLTVRYALEAPRSAGADGRRRGAELERLEIVTELTLTAGSRVVACRTTVDNTARDHRLRLLFPLDGKRGPVRAGAAYDVMAWPEAIEQPPEDVWVENEPTAFPFQHFVYADGPRSRFVFTAKGLHEYEWVPSRSLGEGGAGADGAGAGARADTGAVKEMGGAEGSAQAGVAAGTEAGGTLAITLLRSVSHLGGADRGMSTTNRPGPGLAAEGGQVLRKLTFEYALTIGGASATAAPWRIADEREAAVLARTASLSPAPRYAAGLAIAAERPLPSECGWLESKEADIHVTAFRPAPDAGGGLELRVVNLGDADKSGEIALRLPVESACETDLAGRKLRELPLRETEAGRSLEVELKPKEIRTIRLR
ncbi:alpha-mannosidase [Cohnella fermenti]|uniref:Glycoside hydrolase family 38 central domain-containing protein n=1 Tax=Cohnella fermenti TaxID=2565925 RepID=A0A4S4BRE2_9BACL|nr:glycosyl hydrolase-related protein [Cohnella fermenti]THF77569.1 hypothetical protein E6C55_16260 [Cohnella fermenti]